jgi:hypothetical protein
MTLKQAGVVLGLVLSNLIVYVTGYFLLNMKIEPPPVAPQPTLVVLLEITALPTATTRPTFTATPRPTPTSTWTPLPQPLAAPTVASPTPIRPRATRPRPTATPVSSPHPPLPPGGANSSNPLMPGSAWQTLPAGASVWYKLGQGGEHIDALLESKIPDGVSMEIFSPSNLDHPIGRGTFERNLGGLSWSGGHWESGGDWLARVTNGSSIAIQYRVTAATQEIDKCESISYWEWIGSNYVYWTRCK